jgi:hypothetical protein
VNVFLHCTINESSHVLMRSKGILVRREGQKIVRRNPCYQIIPATPRVPKAQYITFSICIVGKVCHHMPTSSLSTCIFMVRIFSFKAAESTGWNQCAGSMKECIDRLQFVVWTSRDDNGDGVAIIPFASSISVLKN